MSGDDWTADDAWHLACASGNPHDWRGDACIACGIPAPTMGSSMTRQWLDFVDVHSGEALTPVVDALGANSANWDTVDDWSPGADVVADLLFSPSFNCAPGEFGRHWRVVSKVGRVVALEWIA